jgi:hypothetical protein
MVTLLWSSAIGLGVVAMALAYVLLELRKCYQTMQAQQAELWKYQAMRAEYEEAQRILSLKRTLSSRLDVSKRECYDRLRRLGFKSLHEYYRSDLWRNTKHRYCTSDYPQRCLVCSACAFELHHRTYARLGEEELFDLVPLCAVHHKQLHALLELGPTLCVKDTHDCLIVLLGKKPTIESDEQERVEGSLEEMQQQGSRAGKPWSADEDAELLCCFDQKMTMGQMAGRLHRGGKAIEVRLSKLGRLSVIEPETGSGVTKSK